MEHRTEMRKQTADKETVIHKKRNFYVIGMMGKILIGHND